MSTIESQPTPPIPPEILSAVFALDESQRRALGYQLIESVGAQTDKPFPGGPDDWREELERRALEVERGGPTYSYEEVEAHIQETLLLAAEARRAREAAKS